MKSKIFTLHLAFFFVVTISVKVSSEQMNLEEFDSYLSHNPAYSINTSSGHESNDLSIFSETKGSNTISPLHDPIAFSEKEPEVKRIKNLQILRSDDQSSPWADHNDYNTRSMEDMLEENLFVKPSHPENERKPYAKYSKQKNDTVRAVPAVSPAPVPPEPHPVQEKQLQEEPRQETPALTRNRGTELLDFVEKWRKSWSSKDIETYMDCYSGDFRSGPLGKRQWRQKKSHLNQKYEYIEVRIDDIVVEQTPGEARISFFQRYTSDKYTTSGRKTLELVTEGDEWKIVKEY